MLCRGQSRMVALGVIQRGKPGELAVANSTACSDSPRDFAVLRCVGNGTEDRIGNGSEDRIRDHAGVLHPLGRGVLCAPDLLAIEEKSLAVKPIAAVLGLDVHAAGLGLGISGCRLDRADRRLVHGKSVASSAHLRNSGWFIVTLAKRSLAL